MATYIPQITDYIPQLQPFQPDYNFLGNMLQTKQSQYDKGYHEVNRAYTTLLNSPMSRESNIKRRDEFFKVINSDIKRISGLDLSRQENVDAANKVFKGFYEDKYMVNDMVKTKQYFEQLQRGQNFKNCLDPEKCGGQYWEEGIKELHYKNDEFKKMTDEESLNYNPGTFTPYYNWQKDALKTAKDAGLDVKYDDITNQWIVRHRNGELVQGGLYSLFKSVHGDDPRVNANYKTKAYVQRKDFIASNADQFGGEDLAEKAYIDRNLQSSVDTAHKNLNVQTKEYENVNSRVAQLEHKKNTRGLTAQEQVAYVKAVEKRDELAGYKSQLQANLDELLNNVNSADINSLRMRVDSGVASMFENHDMVSLAHTLSLKDKELTVTANPYGEIWARAAVEKQMKILQHGLDLDKLKVEYGLKMSLEDYKNGLKSGQIPFSTAEMLDAVPGTDVQVNTQDNPEAAYDRNRSLAINDMNSANQQSTNVAFNLFSAARNAAINQKSAGAIQWLTDNFGADWNKVSDREGFVSLLNSGKATPMGIFRNAIESLDPEKNPTKDTYWAHDVLNKNKGEIYNLQKFNDATVAKIGFNIGNNKRVVSNMQRQATDENAFLKDADLILKNGFIRSDSEAPIDFIRAYQDRHPMATEDDAKGIYGTLRKNFYYEYNKTKGVSLDQGAGLSGAGMISSTGMLHRSLDPANADANHFGVEANILRDLSKILSTPGAYTATIGGVDSDTFKKGNIPGLDGILNTFLMDAIHANYKTKNRPVFDAEVYPVAANSEAVSAIKLRLDPDYLKKFVGTKDNPGPLYGKAAQLQDGITLFYNNDQVPTTLKSEMQTSPLETILKVKGHYSITPFESTAGRVDFNYDHVSGKVHVIPHYKGYRNGVYGNIDAPAFDVPLSSLNGTEQTQLQALQAIHQRVLQGQQIEAANNR